MRKAGANYFIYIKNKYSKFRYKGKWSIIKQVKI